MHSARAGSASAASESEAGTSASSQGCGRGASRTSALEGEERREPEGHRDVVDDVVLAHQLLLAEVVAHVEADGQPAVQEDLGASSDAEGGPAAHGGDGHA